MMKQHALYTAEQTRELDRLAIEQGVTGYELMNRAGESLLNHIRQQWPDTRQLAVFCGAGNNAGDGYVLARLAQAAGLTAHVYYLFEPEKLTGEALMAWQDCMQAGVVIEPFVSGMHRDTDVVVDALIGTGLQRPLEDLWLRAVDCMNVSPWPVVSADIPSGINANSGQAMGAAVRADMTVSFIGLNRGLFTGDGPEYTGRVVFDDLDVEDTCYEALAIEAALITGEVLHSLHPRARTLYKNQCGHVLVVGGNTGMAGAAVLAARAALRAGAGLVSLATRPEHVAAAVAAQQELMVHGVSEADDLNGLLAKASTIVIGPGLGQDRWSHRMLGKVLESRKPMVIDADALNLLSKEPMRCENWILTPHAGEAGRLLGMNTAEVNADRFTAVHQLQQNYGGVAVLKGAGTLVASHTLGVCAEGNPGMATAGMGDVLGGIIAALVAQGLPHLNAAELGVWVHARAGDMEAEEYGERGMVASDLLPQVRTILNAGPV